jgi:hypothetical protein
MNVKEVLFPVGFEVPTTMIMKDASTIFRNCWLLAWLTVQPRRWRLVPYLQNVGELLPDCTMSHP